MKGSNAKFIQSLDIINKQVFVIYQVGSLAIESKRFSIIFANNFFEIFQNATFLRKKTNERRIDVVFKTMMFSLQAVAN